MKTRNLLVAAAITGALAAAPLVARAETAPFTPGSTVADRMGCNSKDGCQGKAHAKGKAKDKKKDKDKNACSGKDGCGGKSGKGKKES
jgi:hypothetical protein